MARNGKRRSWKKTRRERKREKAEGLAADTVGSGLPAPPIPRGFPVESADHITPGPSFDEIGDHVSPTPKYSPGDKLSLALFCASAFLGLATFLVPKTRFFITGILLLMSAFAVYPVYHFLRKWRARLSLYVIILVVEFVLGYFVWPHPVDHARLSITGISVVPPHLSTGPDAGKAYFNIFYSNTGQLKAKGFLWRTSLLNGTHILSKEEEYRWQDKGLRFDWSKEADTNVETLPESMDPRNVHFYSYPSQPGPEMDWFTITYPRVITGREIIYLFADLIYKDATMDSDVVGVTEFCGWFGGSFNYWHVCGRSRSLLMKIPKLT